MCGRYANSHPPVELARLFHAVSSVREWRPSWNIAPSSLAPVVRCHPQTGERHLDLLSWGLLPSWTRNAATARRPINARAETLAATPSFQGAYRARRCLVPASAFYEWQRTGGAKQPFAFARADEAPLALAGLWEGFRWPDGKVARTFAIVTTAANALMAPIHARMPVLLEPADWPLWLGETAGDPAPLLHPPAEDVLHCWPVGTRVNTPGDDDASLLAPVQESAT